MSTHCEIDTPRRLGARPYSIVLCLTAVALLCVQAGCSTAGALGLPVSAGPYKLLTAANKIRDAAGHPQEVAHEMSKTVQTAHQVEPGDVVVIEATDFDSPIRFPGDQTVQADGTIDLGQYGRVQVVGLTLEEIKFQALKQIASAYDSPGKIAAVSAPGRATAVPEAVRLTVRLLSNESSVVYVLGEVNAPGSFPVVGRETVLDCIIAAGGVTDRANEHKIILTRPASPGEPREILPICYPQIVQLGDPSTNYQVQPGDRIYVPSLTLLEDIRQSVPYKRSSCPHCKDFTAE